MATDDLFAWIDTYSFSRSKKNVNRDFSDAVLLAELLKKHYPRIVQLHNYAPKNSFSGKLENWNTLNSKVLKKIKLGLNKETIEKLANSEQGVIEKVLMDVRQKVENENTNTNDLLSTEILSVDCITGEITEIPIKISNNCSDGYISEQKLVSEITMSKIIEELSEKKEAIEILNQKIDHLENLMKIKDQRIIDLNTQLQRYRNMDKSSNFLSLIPKLNHF